MTGILQAILSFFGVAPAAAANYIEDVFSTYLYTGTGATQTITNNIDTSTKGGLVWIKSRSNALGHRFTDTARGATLALASNNTNSEATDTTGLTSFGTTGFTIGADASYNTSAATFASWTFRKQAKFFDVVTYTGNGSNRTIAHNLGSVPGCIIIKCRSTGGTNWPVYHRSLANTEYLLLNSTNAKATGATYWNSTTATSTNFSLGTTLEVNGNGDTYVAYLFAHDAGGFGATGSDNVISCGSVVGVSGDTTANIGYEPQWLLIKNTTSASDWWLVDTMRGLCAPSTNAKLLVANKTDAEAALGLYLTSTGFTSPNLTAGETYIYIAIRRGPMKTPTSGTSVYNAKTYAGTNTTNSQTGLGFPPDITIFKGRDNSVAPTWVDRLRGQDPYITSNATSAEASATLVGRMDMDGFTTSSSYSLTNQSGTNYIGWCFRRAPGFFDEVCYTGTAAAQTQSHNLGVAPELMIVKRRSAAASWAVYSSALGNTKSLELNSTGAVINSVDLWNSTTPTSSVFSIGGSDTSVNASGSTYVAYLFATVAGVSKVGSYTGSGTTKQIDCGFTAGARFVMIKRTDSTGDWYVWDSARGIVAGNDPYLLLNSLAVEVTNTDYVDTSNAGFEISSTAPAAINANGGTFIFLAIA